MKKIFVFMGLVALLIVVGASNARWYGGGSRFSFGIGLGGPGYWGGSPYRYGYWGSPYWGPGYGGGYYRPVYRPARPSKIEIVNNSNVTIEVNDRSVQPGSTTEMRYNRFINIKSIAGNVDIENPPSFIDVFRGKDGKLDADIS